MGELGHPDIGNVETPMCESSVLIISRHPLLAEAVRHVVEQSGIREIYQVRGLVEAFPIVCERQPGTIIVDLERDIPCESVAAQLISEHGADCQVICISLDKSDITVFSRHHIPRAGQSELVALLRGTLDSTVGELS